MKIIILFYFAIIFICIHLSQEILQRCLLYHKQVSLYILQYSMPETFSALQELENYFLRIKQLKLVVDHNFKFTFKNF